MAVVERVFTQLKFLKLMRIFNNDDLLGNSNYLATSESLISAKINRSLWSLNECPLFFPYQMQNN